MNHKRKRPKSRRAGCLGCKPWKVSGSKLSEQLKPSEQRAVQPEEGRHGKKHRASRVKWCRGKEGVLHQPVCMTYEQAKGLPRFARQAVDRFLVCKACGKVLAHYWASFDSSRKEKPDWVTD